MLDCFFAFFVEYLVLLALPQQSFSLVGEGKRVRISLGHAGISLAYTYTMTRITDAYCDGVDAALEKMGATRLVRNARQAVQQGDLSRAHRLINAPGGLSPGQQRFGIPIKELGRGGEGVADLVMKPGHADPLAVRKTFDPAGAAYSPELVRRKEELAKHNLPHLAQLRGRETTRAGSPVHFSEYVRGKEVSDHARPASFAPAHQELARAMYDKGYYGADMRAVNAIQTPTGQTKFIDYAPLKPHEVHPAHEQIVRNTPNVIPVSPNYVQSLFPSSAGAPRELSTPQLRASLYGEGRKNQPPAAQPTRIQGLAADPRFGPTKYMPPPVDPLRGPTQFTPPGV